VAEARGSRLGALADSAGLYLRLVNASLRAQLAYRADFLLNSAGIWFATGLEALVVWLLFERFESLVGWSLPEVFLFYGTVNSAFAVADALGVGFDQFARKVRAGDFDRVLLRPRSSALLILGEELALRRVGRFTQGAMVLAWALHELPIAWDASRLAVWLFAFAGAVCLFLGLFVFQATAAFWTVEALETFNAFSYGGSYAAQYPLTIYAPWFRKFFTFVVPLATVTYFPLLFVLGRRDALGSPPWLQALAPAAGVTFLVLAFVAFRIGIRKYTSTGS
jgi:ABC-2 type transport system permease protein